ncbi:MAG: hypothetical protein JWN82_546 [Candidatus Saccharibacteria bacterium]|nr:hypothetical protein [Candidatus Saccharibacteria bacterium]
MIAMEQVVEDRLAHPQNAVMLDNLAQVVRTAEAQPLVVQDGRLRRAEADCQRSGQRISRGKLCFINRTVQQLSAPYNVAPAQLAAAASGGTVVDVGAGQSEFLRSFQNESVTIAVDLNQHHVAYQRARGHIAVRAMAEDLSVLESASVRLLHASYSAPFWSASPEKAKDAASEFVRLLEPGGIGLVGPFGVQADRLHHERSVLHLRSRGLDLGWSWPKDSDEFQTKTRLAFCERLLDATDITLVAHRFSPDSPDPHGYRPDIHVPNYLLINKL